ncbi:MAG: hypothetical protein ACXAC8_07580 [Candidatus Hodarchaeales archaeon]
MPKKPLIKQALKFAEAVKAQGIAELLHAFIDNDEKLLWCTWETNDMKALEAAFAEMNKQSGLKSELKPIEQFYPE